MPVQRTITFSFAVIFVIANIIGSGVYKKVAPMAAELQSAPLVLLCWLAGGVITLFGALCVAELAAMMPQSGGEFQYHRKIYNRFFAFTYGWASYTVIKTGTIASLAYVFAQSLHEIVPPLQTVDVKVTAIVLILLLTLFNALGIKTGVRLSATILGLVVAGIALIVLAGAYSAESKVSNIATTSEVPFNASTFLTAMLSAFFAYEGWKKLPS